MTHTHAEVSFGIGFIVEIQQDSIPTSPNLQPFSNINDLRTGSATNRPFATFEPDFWLLDGEYKLLPTELRKIHIGMMTLAMSDDAGAYAVPPVLTIDFNEVHSVDGLTLRFAQYSGDYINDLDVAFYDDTATLIQTDNYTPTAWEYFTGKAVENFKQIVITFNSSSHPFRYVRLTAIDYGELIKFTDADVLSASVVEETNILGSEARIGTCDLRLYTEDADFSPINPTGRYASLAQRKPLTVSEQIGNQSVLIGQYYLDTWTNQTETVLEFTCVNLLGVLDTMTYKGILIASPGTALETLLDAILGPLHVPYDLHQDLYSSLVVGWIPICSYREALQQIAFSVGAYLDCSRDRPIKIYPTRLASDNAIYYDVSIPRSDQGMGGKVTLNSEITGAEVTAHHYAASATSKSLFSNATQEEGIFTISFTEPIHDLAVVGATIIESGANYAVLNVTGAAHNVTLSGQIYTEKKMIFSVYTPDLPASVSPNIVRVEEATLVSPTNGQAIAQRVYDYYQQRYIQKMRLFASQIAIGDVALAETLYGQQIRGVVEKTEINLSGGFISQVEITGVKQ